MLISLDRCLECGAPATEHHHVIPRIYGGTATVPLCSPCHDRAHGKVRHLRGAFRRLITAGQDKAREAGVHVGRPPYGYETSKSGELVPLKHEQSVARMIQRLRNEEMWGWRDIARAFRRWGVVNRAKRPMSAENVQRICQSFSDRQTPRPPPLPPAAPDARFLPGQKILFDGA